jgi:hypothetical protein
MEDIRLERQHGRYRSGETAWRIWDRRDSMEDIGLERQHGGYGTGETTWRI